MPQFRPDVPPHIAETVRHLPPDIKQAVKSAMRLLSADPYRGVPLLRELEGFWKYRVRRFRIVYAIEARTRTLRIVAIGHRQEIYEEMIERLQGRVRGARRDE